MSAAARIGTVNDLGVDTGANGVQTGLADTALFHHFQTLLGSWSEGPYGFDFIAEKLDPERLITAEREDINNPAAHGKFTPGLTQRDAFHAAVSQGRD